MCALFPALLIYIMQVYKKGKTVYATTEALASLAQLNTNAVHEIYILTGDPFPHLLLHTYHSVFRSSGCSHSSFRPSLFCLLARFVSFCLLACLVGRPVICSSSFFAFPLALFALLHIMRTHRPGAILEDLVQVLRNYIGVLLKMAEYVQIHILSLACSCRHCFAASLARVLSLGVLLIVSRICHSNMPSSS